jgi:tetratricopeptide (TPR) repeat protein
MRAEDDRLAKGIALFAEGRYSQALPEFENAQGGTAVAYRALTQAAMNNCAAALPVLSEQSKAVDTELGKLAAIAAVKCYSAAGQNGAAAMLLQALRKQYPKDSDVLYMAAETEMKAFNETTFAMFQQAPSSYRVHQLSAEILEVQNHYTEAAAEYRRAIELSPKAPDLHYRLGRALLLADHSSPALHEAATAFEAELQISPEDSASDFQLGQIAQVEGHAEQAEECFKKALKISPTFETAMIALGKLYTAQKKYEPAISLLKQAAASQPENEAAHYALLTAYRDAGQRAKALEEKTILDRLQKPPDGEFSQFLQKLESKPPRP